MQEKSNLNFRRELDALATLRDELKLKAHLARADVRDELDKLETRFQRMEEDLRRNAADVKENVKEPLETIGQGTKDLISELKTSYDNLRRRFS